MAKKQVKAKTKNTVTATSSSVMVSLALPGWFTNARLHAWLIFLTGFLLYANTLGHDYAQDDDIVIVQNMFTTKGIAGIPSILQYDTFYGYFKDKTKATLVAGGRYRPLSLVFFAIEYQLFGANPLVGHLVNALLYGLTGAMLYWLLLQCFRPKDNAPKAYFIVIIASFLFVTHPLHTEVVANIKGRDEILALLGSLAALYWSLRAHFSGKQWLHFAVGFIFFLALMSKENAITFVAVTPLTYWFFTSAKPRRIFMHTLPFMTAAAIFLAIRGAVIGFVPSDPPGELMNNPFLKLQGGVYVPFTPDERLATVIFTLGKYLLLLFFPHPLTHDYYPRHIGIMNFGQWQALLSLLIYVVLLLYSIFGLRRKDPVAYGIWFYLLTLSIVSNVVFPVGTNMAERLLFMPSVGFCIAVAVLAQRLTFKKKITSFGQLHPVLGAFIIVVLLFSVKTITRNQAWKDNFTLFQTDIYTSPNSAKLRNALGSSLVDKAVAEKDEQQRRQMLQEAAGHLQEAIKIHPFYENALLYLTACYRLLAKYDESIAVGQRALRQSPEKGAAELASAYFEAGRYYGQQLQDWQKAVGYLENARQLRPNDFGTLQGLGVAYGSLGNSEKAIEFFMRALQVNPNDADAWFNLGLAYLSVGNQIKGNECLQRAEQLEPDIRRRRQQ